MKKIIFLDVDGTLAGVKDGKQYIPERAIEVIQKSRKKGNMIFLCTGRSQAEIGDIMDIGFDGVIGAAGGYILYKNQLIFHKELNEEAVSKIAKFLNEQNAKYYLESNDGLFCNKAQLDSINEYIEKGFDPNSYFFKIMKPLEEKRGIINKISYQFNGNAYEKMMKEFGNEYHIVKSSYEEGIEAGEISNKGITKATAIQFLMNYIQLDDYKTFGFGDSMNDLEMFEEVDVAVAMGNGRDGVLEKADYVTADLYHDGIAQAFNKLNLI